MKLGPCFLESAVKNMPRDNASAQEMITNPFIWSFLEAEQLVAEWNVMLASQDLATLGGGN
jgi:hypothetical protein